MFFKNDYTESFKLDIKMFADWTPTRGSLYLEISLLQSEQEKRMKTDGVKIGVMEMKALRKLLKQITDEEKE